MRNSSALVATSHFEQLRWRVGKSLRLHQMMEEESRVIADEVEAVQKMDGDGKDDEEGRVQAEGFCFFFGTTPAVFSAATYSQNIHVGKVIMHMHTHTQLN